jgi:hypothetical protein
MGNKTGLAGDSPPFSQEIILAKRSIYYRDTKRHLPVDPGNGSRPVVLSVKLESLVLL